MSVAFGSTVTVLLLYLQVAIGNVHIGTTNGLWKSIDVQRWMTSAPWAIFNPVPGGLTSNALLYVTHANLGRLYDSTGVFPNLIWRQMAVTNALFAGLGAAAAFLFVARWQGSRLLALLAGTAYSLSGYVLLHGLINEDIMPGFVLVLIATLMACAWFGAPTWPRIAAVAVVFALGWLYEWRLIFPSLPPLLLALFLAPGRAWERLARPACFLAMMAIPPVLLAAHATRARGGGLYAFFEMVAALFWTSKGVGSAWAGWSETKLYFLWAGVTEAVIFGRHIGQPRWLEGPFANEVLIATAIMLALALITLLYAWRHRTDPTIRGALVILGGTFVAGTVFNLYSQPQDPQMQVNVMVWTLFGWTLALGGLVAWARRHAQVMRALGLGIATGVALAGPAATLRVMFEQRGQDTSAYAVLVGLESRFDPARTVFVLYDFDGLVSWMAANWSHTPPKAVGLPPVPAERPKFKWVGVLDPVHNVTWNGDQHADEVLRQLRAAQTLGYRLIASYNWTLPEQNWIDGFAQVASAAKAATIYRRLTEATQATEVWRDPNGRGWYELTLREP